jgi:SAM-dependent methyltransferase
VDAESDSASFQKPAEAYDRFIGRYGPQLAAALLDRIDPEPGWKVLDVGSGPGPLTAALADALGAGSVAAVEPSEPFARACRKRVPGADVRVASAEELPFQDDSFHATVSQLVVNFLPDAPAALREMRRVTRPGGLIAGSVWDYAGEMTMLRAFWDAARDIDEDTATRLDEGRRMPYSRPDDLMRLWSDAGLAGVTTEGITATAGYADFEDLWGPFTLGVGPAGSYCASLSEPKRETLKDRFRSRLGSPEGSFELAARAWLVRGGVPGHG